MRKACNLPQNRIAKVLGIDQAGISRIESGQQSVTIGQLKLLSKFYDVDMDYIIAGRVNLWKISKKFGQYHKIPKRYLNDATSLFREFIPFLAYIRNVYGISKEEDILERLQLEHIKYVDPNEGISVKAFYDFMNIVIAENLISEDMIPHLLSNFSKIVVNDELFSICKKNLNTKEILIYRIANSCHCDGLIRNKIIDINDKTLSSKIEINKAAQKLDFMKNNLGAFLTNYIKQYYSLFPTFFSKKPAKILYFDSPFLKKISSGKIIMNF